MRNKLATVLTGAMLVLTTNALPSSALNAAESSVTNATKLENPISQTQTTKNSELLIARKGVRRHWITKEYKCRMIRVYSPRRKRVIRVKKCRRVQVKTFYPRFF